MCRKKKTKFHFHSSVQYYDYLVVRLNSSDCWVTAFEYLLLHDSHLFLRRPYSTQHVSSYDCFAGGNFLEASSADIYKSVGITLWRLFNRIVMLPQYAIVFARCDFFLNTCQQIF